MNLQDTPDELRFRESVRLWMTSHLDGPFESLRGAGGFGSPEYQVKLAKQWEQELFRGGWTGLDWPKQHGGRELPLSLQMIFHEEYVRCGGPGRLGHIGETLLAPTLIAWGSESQQKRFLPGVLEGRVYWAQGFSEPGAGSDLAAVQTRARQDPASGEWIINGQKVWTSWAHEADWIFVLARFEDLRAGQAPHKGLVFLLVPLDQAGIEIRPIRQITGGHEFNEIFFTDARTESSLQVGKPGEGWYVAMHMLNGERGASTLGQQAHFRKELNDVLEIARHNGTFQDPLIRQKLAKAAMGLETLRFHALRTCGTTSNQRALSISKFAWSNWRRSLGELTMEILGEKAQLADDEPLIQRLHHIWLSSRADTIYAGTNEIQLNLIAERALGMPR
jgi:alkylation response protein AidB-like acyl-CoA dehydrogenase